VTFPATPSLTGKKQDLTPAFALFDLAADVPAGWDKQRKRLVAIPVLG